MEYTHLHYFGYIFVGFAHLSDKKFSEEEHKKVIELVDDWAGAGRSDASFAITMAEVMMWYDEIKEFDKKQEHFLKTLDFLAVQDWFKPEMKKKFIEHLWQLAAADGIVESEREYIKMIADKWGVPSI